MKHSCCKIGEKSTLHLQRSQIPHPMLPKSSDIVTNEIMESITSTNDNHTDRKVPVHEAAGKEDLLILFDKYLNLMSPTLD